MQELIKAAPNKNKQKKDEDLQLLGKFADFGPEKNSKEQSNKVSRALLNDFYWHEVYNQRYQSICLPPVPLERLPAYLQLRPYQKQQVKQHITNKFKYLQTNTTKELILKLAQFMACAYSKKYRKNIKKENQIKKKYEQMSKKKQIGFYDIKMVTPIGNIIYEYQKQKQDKFSKNKCVPVLKLRRYMKGKMNKSFTNFDEFQKKNKLFKNFEKQNTVVDFKEKPGQNSLPRNIPKNKLLAIKRKVAQCSEENLLNIPKPIGFDIYDSFNGSIFSKDIAFSFTRSECKLKTANNETKVYKFAKIFKKRDRFELKNKSMVKINLEKSTEIPKFLQRPASQRHSALSKHSIENSEKNISRKPSFSIKQSNFPRSVKNLDSTEKNICHYRTKALNVKSAKKIADIQEKKSTRGKPGYSAKNISISNCENSPGEGSNYHKIYNPNTLIRTSNFIVQTPSNKESSDNFRLNKNNIFTNKMLNHLGNDEHSNLQETSLKKREEKEKFKVLLDHFTKQGRIIFKSQQLKKLPFKNNDEKISSHYVSKMDFFKNHDQSRNLSDQKNSSRFRRNDSEDSKVKRFPDNFFCSKSKIVTSEKKLKYRSSASLSRFFMDVKANCKPKFQSKSPNKPVKNAFIEQNSNINSAQNMRISDKLFPFKESNSIYNFKKSSPEIKIVSKNNDNCAEQLREQAKVIIENINYKNKLKMLEEKNLQKQENALKKVKLLKNNLQTSHSSLISSTKRSDLGKAAKKKISFFYLPSYRKSRGKNIQEETSEDLLNKYTQKVKSLYKANLTDQHVSHKNNMKNDNTEKSSNQYGSTVFKKHAPIVRPSPNSSVGFDKKVVFDSKNLSIDVSKNQNSNSIINLNSKFMNSSAKFKEIENLQNDLNVLVSNPMGNNGHRRNLTEIIFSSKLYTSKETKKNN